MRKKEGTRFTREALYELVWSKPMTEIAADFGMSSTAFAKHCKKLSVPIPGRGYWQRVASGHRKKKPALRNAPVKTPPFIEIVKREPREHLAMVAPDVCVADQLHDPHPAVARMRELMQRPDGKEATTLPGSGHAAFSVAAENKIRALRILDALFKALDGVGASTEVWTSERGNRHALQIRLANRPVVEVWLTEHLKRTPHVPNDFDASWGEMFARKYDYEHSGRLIIEIAAPYSQNWFRRKWSDTETIPLEQKLGEVVVGLHHAADALAAQNERWERERKVDEERRQRQVEEERRRKHHDALGADLRNMAARWQEAETVRAFLKTLNAAIPVEGRTDTFGAWRQWAGDYVRELDPFERPLEIAKPPHP